MKLIDPEQIRFVIAPIAPMLSGGLVHYERVAFQQEVSQDGQLDHQLQRTDGMPHSSRVQMQQMRTADRPGLQQAIQILPELRGKDG